MAERVDTKELELQILKVKADKLAVKIDELNIKIKNKEIGILLAIEELEKARKELVDCASIQLGIELAGPVAVLTTVDAIMSLDRLLFSLRILSNFEQ